MKKYLKILALPLLVPLFFAGAVYGATAINSIINPPNLDSGLIGHWTFDGKDLISNVADTSGQGNNGKFKGSTATTTVPGSVGQAITLNGTTQYISVPVAGSTSGTNSDANLDPTFISLCAWIKTTYTTNAGFTTIFSRDGLDASTRIWQWRVTGDGSAGHNNFIPFNQVQANGNITGTKNVSDGKWHFVCGTWNGTTEAVYTDGALDNSDAFSGTNLYATAANTAGNEPLIGAIGRAGPTNTFAGSMDDVRIYNRALSAAEVSQLYQSGQSLHPNITVNPPNLDSGLAGHWTFDGKDLISNVADSSGNGHNGFLVGYAAATTTVPGMMGQALSFNGTSQYADTNTRLGTMAPTNGSACIWAYHRTAFNGGTIQAMIDAEESSPATKVFQMVHYSDNNLYLGFFDGVTPSRVFFAADATTWPLKKWTQYCVTWVSGGTITAYINGAVTGTPVSGITILNPNTTIHLGLYTATTQYYNGILDDARIWNRALSAAEISQLYQSGQSFHPNAAINPPNLQSGLVGHWTFDGKDLISNVADSSGQGNTGHLVSFTSTTTTAGVEGQALSFNGSDYVSIPSVSALNSYPITISGWFFMTQTNQTQFTGLLNKYISGSLNGWNLELNDTNCAGNKVRFFYFVDGSNNVGNASNICSGSLSTGQWHFVAATVDSGGGTLYMDGASVSTGVWTGTPGATTQSQAMFIANYAGTDFQGYEDDVRIYNRALSAAEVKQLYNLGR